MISNHYAMLHTHKFNWLILMGLCVAGAAIRVWFVQRHFGRASFVPLAIAVALLAIIAAVIAPKPVKPLANDAAVPTLNAVHDIVSARCASCHADVPTQAGFAAPPKGIVFNTIDDTQTQAEVIYQQVVVTKAMPIGNLTGITDDERATIDTWFRSLAK